MYRKRIGQIIPHIWTADEVAAGKFLLSPPPPADVVAGKKMYAIMQDAPPMVMPNDFAVTGGNMFDINGKGAALVTTEGATIFVIYNA